MVVLADHPLVVLGFLLYDVAEDASFLVLEVATRTLNLLYHPLGDYGSGNQLAVAMLQ